jgi:hypothetical protein
MTIPEKVKELLEQLEVEQLDDVVWRGFIDDLEWKILLHKNPYGIIYITVKERKIN